MRDAVGIFIYNLQYTVLVLNLKKLNNNDIIIIINYCDHKTICKKTKDSSFMKTDKEKQNMNN